MEYIYSALHLSMSLLHMQCSCCSLLKHYSYLQHRRCNSVLQLQKNFPLHIWNNSK